MRNRKIVKVSALLIGCLVTLSTTAFADGTSNVNATTSASIQAKPAIAGKAAPGRFDGIGHKGDMRDKGGMFKAERGPADFSTTLKDFVTDGTITQATLDKITAYQKEEQAARQAEMDKIKAMTPEQRKAYFEANKPTNDPAKKMSPFSNLVEKGIITQQQADTIMQKLHDKQEAQEQAAMKTQLDTQVANKTITQDQANKVLAYLQKLDSDRAAKMQKMQAMTQAEREAYFKSQAGQRINPLAQLVKDGVLTQAQSDSIAKVMHPMQPGHMGGKPHGNRGK